MANDHVPGPGGPEDEGAEPRAVNEGDFGDEGDDGDFGDDGDGGDFGDGGEGDSAVEIIYEDEVDAVTVFDVADEAADVAADVVADVSADITLDVVGDVILDIVAAIVLLLAEVDDPAWVNDPARRNVALAEIRPVAQDFASRGVAPSADELRVLRDRIRARWRDRE